VRQIKPAQLAFGRILIVCFFRFVGPVASERDVDSLRADLQLLVEWSADWQMLFNVQKCKVLHVGYNNMCASYFIGNSEIQSTDEERDLGVVVHKSLKVSSPCNKVVKEAYSILGVINRCFLKTSTCIPNFIEIEETFSGRTDGRTDGHFSPSNIIRSTFGSRPKNVVTLKWGSEVTQGH